MTLAKIADLALTNEELGIFVRILATQGLSGGVELVDLAEAINVAPAKIQNVLERTAIFRAKEEARKTADRQRKVTLGMMRNRAESDGFQSIPQEAPPSPDGPFPLPPAPPTPIPLNPPSPRTKTGAETLVEGFVPSDAFLAAARGKYPAVDVSAELDHWRDYLRANGYRSRTGPVKDAAASFRTWLANAQKWSKPHGGPTTRSSGAAAQPARKLTQDFPHEDIRDPDVRKKYGLPPLQGGPAGGPDGAVH